MSRSSRGGSNATGSTDASRSKDVLYRYERHVLPAYRRYIEPHKLAADLIVNNETSFTAALEVLIGYLLSRSAA